jgi:type VI secretion system protein
MLTTRQGAVQALPDYGLPDLNDLNLSRAEVMRQCCNGHREVHRRVRTEASRGEVAYSPLDDGQLHMVFSHRGDTGGSDGMQVPWRWSIVMEGDQVRGAA